MVRPQLGVRSSRQSQCPKAQRWVSLGLRELQVETSDDIIEGRKLTLRGLRRLVVLSDLRVGFEDGLKLLHLIVETNPLLTRDLAEVLLGQGHDRLDEPASRDVLPQTQNLKE